MKNMQTIRVESVKVVARLKRTIINFVSFKLIMMGMEDCSSIDWFNVCL